MFGDNIYWRNVIKKNSKNITRIFVDCLLIVLSVGYDDRLEDLDGKPYLALGYANGPGYTKHRRNNGTHITRRSPEEFGDELCKNYNIIIIYYNYEYQV